MYLSSASSILPGDQERAARHLACEAARRNDAAVQSVKGRVELWQTITSPSDLAEMFGAQLGANALMMQDATAAARQASMLSSGPDSSLGGVVPTPQQVIDSAPKSYSLNGQPSQVNGCDWAPAPQVPLSPSPTPTMPLRAPVVYQTAIGPASLPPPGQSRNPGGLTGYAPPWSDALVTDSQAQMDNPDTGVGAWIASHPWLSLAIAVGGAVVLSRRGK